MLKKGYFAKKYTFPESSNVYKRLLNGFRSGGEPFLIGFPVSGGITEMLGISGGEIVPSVEFGPGAKVQIIMFMRMQNTLYCSF